MKGSVQLLELILISAVAITLIGITIPWLLGSMGDSLDAGELSNIESQFKYCSDKILETARTGTTNKCIFSVSRGTISGEEIGLEYSLVSEAPICDPHGRVLIDEKNHIYQECKKVGKQTTYKMVWAFPEEITIEGKEVTGQMQGETPIGNIVFNDEITFITTTLIVEFEYVKGVEGNNVEFGRKEMSNNKIKLSVDIY